MDRIKHLEEKLSEEKTRNFKLMWKYASGEWKFVYIVGIITLLYLSLKFGLYIGRSIG